MILKYILLATTAISIYIILCVGLGWFWTVGSSINSDKINQILINLSYSYIAGFIFYVLVSYLPYTLKVQKIKPAIKLKTNNLSIQINACIQTFATEENRNFIESITKEQLRETVNRNEMYNNSFYANEISYVMNNLKFLNSTKGNVFEIIDSLLGYKEYMKSEQILYLEKIRDSEFFHLVKTYEETDTARVYYSSQPYKETLINDLFEVVKNLNNLKKIT